MPLCYCVSYIQGKCEVCSIEHNDPLFWVEMCRKVYKSAMTLLIIFILFNYWYTADRLGRERTLVIQYGGWKGLCPEIWYRDADRFLWKWFVPSILLYLFVCKRSWENLSSVSGYMYRGIKVRGGSGSCKKNPTYRWIPEAKASPHSPGPSKLPDVHYCQTSDGFSRQCIRNRPSVTSLMASVNRPSIKPLMASVDSVSETGLLTVYQKQAFCQTSDGFSGQCIRNRPSVKPLMDSVDSVSETGLLSNLWWLQWTVYQKQAFCQTSDGFSGQCIRNRPSVRPLMDSVDSVSETAPV